MLPVAGLDRTSPQFRAELIAMARRNAWDVDALAAVISIETGGTFAPDAGWQNWSPRRTAIGLIQFIEGTAKGLGVEPSFSPPHYRMLEAAEPGSAWSTWTLAKMTAVEQLPWVEKYFRRAFASKAPTRPVDYFLATLVVAPGLPDSTVFATRGDAIYDANSGLDRDGSGRLEVSDLRVTVDRVLDAARERAGNAKPGGSSLGGFVVELLFGFAMSRFLTGRKR